MLASISPTHSGALIFGTRPQKYQTDLGRRISISDSCMRISASPSRSFGGVVDQGLELVGINGDLSWKVRSRTGGPQCRAGSASDSKVMMTANNLEPSPGQCGSIGTISSREIMRQDLACVNFTDTCELLTQLLAYSTSA